jgi:hypothetical protein
MVRVSFDNSMFSFFYVASVVSMRQETGFELETMYLTDLARWGQHLPSSTAKGPLWQYSPIVRKHSSQNVHRCTVKYKEGYCWGGVGGGGHSGIPPVIPPLYPAVHATLLCYKQTCLVVLSTVTVAIFKEFHGFQLML